MNRTKNNIMKELLKLKELELSAAKVKLDLLLNHGMDEKKSDLIVDGFTLISDAIDSLSKVVSKDIG